MVNGKEEPAKKKFKLPPDVDWQAIARDKQEDEKKAKKAKESK